MGQWLYIDKDYDELSQTTIAPSGEVVDGRFNVTLGLEPMNDNVFEKQLVKLNTLCHSESQNIEEYVKEMVVTYHPYHTETAQ